MYEYGGIGSRLLMFLQSSQESCKICSTVNHSNHVVPPRQQQVPLGMDIGCREKQPNACISVTNSMSSHRDQREEIETPRPPAFRMSVSQPPDHLDLDARDDLDIRERFRGRPTCLYLHVYLYLHLYMHHIRA